MKQIIKTCIGKELNKGDVIYCYPEFMTVLTHGNSYKLEVGQTIYPDDDSLRENGAAFMIIGIDKEKKYPTKKWWQFWLKQEENAIGYKLIVV